jgi:hypothetical protein
MMYVKNNDSDLQVFDIYIFREMSKIMLLKDIRISSNGSDEWKI